MELTAAEANEQFNVEKKAWPVWFYAAVFFIPCIIAFISLRFVAELDLLFSGIIALAVMNGSINSVIAYITIRLDDKSSESLQHLEFLNNEMDKLEDTLSEANEKVTSFTGDLEEAKDVFKKIGVDLNEIDLNPIAEVVTKLKENKDGLNEVLDHMREIDVTEYIDQAKRIDWKQLLGAAEEIMGFIKQRDSMFNSPLTIAPTLASLQPNVPENEDSDLDWEQYSDSQAFTKPARPKRAATLTREPIEERKPMPKPIARLSRGNVDKSSGKLTLKR